MTKLLHLFSTEYGREDSLYTPRALPNLHIDPTDGQLVQFPSTSMSYRDIISMSGMSWSNMLRETSTSELTHLNCYSSRRPSSEYNSRNHVQLPKVIVKKAPYHWTRTEDLEPKLRATDRPYRNTYGDGTSSPSKLHLSTELPDIISDPGTLSVQGYNRPGYETKKWTSNKQIAKIYNLLHSGDAQKLSKLHVITRRGAHTKRLPKVLPHFYLQLNQSINKVLKEEEIQPEIVFARRPLTSERITYKPITERSSNPELSLSKTGKIEFHSESLSKNLRSYNTFDPANPLSATITELKISPMVTQLQAKSKTIPFVIPNRLPKVGVDRESYYRTRKRTTPVKSPPKPQSKVAVANVTTSLQSAEGFPLTVKITPKKHPANSKVVNDVI